MLAISANSSNGWVGKGESAPGTRWGSSGDLGRGFSHRTIWSSMENGMPS